MSNTNEVVAQTYFEISEVQYQNVTEPLDFSKDVFTYLKSTYTAKGMQPISLSNLEQHINEYRAVQGEKTANRCILKGLYNNDFNGENCTQGAPFLFFDIDVKQDKENTHLLSESANRIIFENLRDIAVLVWRSNSGNGIAGILYVPQMEAYLNDQRDLHLLAGKAITNFLSEFLHKKTGIGKIIFDDAQSKFRQVRFLAEQKENRKLNPYPLEFSYKVDEKIKEIKKGVTAYRYADYRTPYGTIYEQFNANNDILTVALNNGFKEINRAANKIRVKHQLSTSATSGEINTALNIYFNYSDSIANGRKSFTPAEMECFFRYGNNWSDFKKELERQGYKKKIKSKNEVKKVSENLKKQLQEATDQKEIEKIIFHSCYDLQTLSDDEKEIFIKESCERPELEKIFKAYLNLQDYQIKYDKDFIIQKYVAEALPDILEYAEKHKKIILRAETGKGKTTAFIRDFHKHRPNTRILILEPLTVILKQNKSEYNDKAVFVDGTSVKFSFDDAKTKNFVFATYEQGAKILQESTFDFIVVDEIHQLITANSFKRSVIADLTPLLRDNVVIGLTGTPTAIFQNIGYKLVNVDVQAPTKSDVEIRYLNNRPYDIGLSHLSQVKGKTLIRLNDIKGIEILKKQLIATKQYKPSEILILYSKEQIKNSDDYKQLAEKRCFKGKIKLVLTTSLIDEGLSIEQEGFTDVVFIETSYAPRPEPIKQFFARFRNENNERKNYLYLRSKNDQEPKRFNPEWMYNEIFRALQDYQPEEIDHDVISTYNSIFSNKPYFNDDYTINEFYLAFSVTDILFRTLNNIQFREYLTQNYNLNLSVNEKFEWDKPSGSLEAHERKEIKQRIAGLWINHKEDIFQVLALHSLDNRIRSELTVQQKVLDTNIEFFIIEQIKDFEKLYKYHKKLMSLGCTEINEVLIKSKNGCLTLQSDKHVRNEIHLLKILKCIFEPKNETDRKEAVRFMNFCQWCEAKKEFTSANMFRELKKIGIRKTEVMNEKMIFQILHWFRFDVKKDSNTNLIKVSSF